MGAEGAPFDFEALKARYAARSPEEHARRQRLMDAAEHSMRWCVSLNEDDARQVRTWRIEDDMTWRGVAAAASQEWRLSYGSNQLFGRDLCRAAAILLGEDPESEPWN